MKNIHILVLTLALGLLVGCVKDEKFIKEPPVVVIDNVLINEVYSRGTLEAPDWVEIYNNSDNQVDISTYLIYDSGGESGAKPKKAFPAGSIIPAHGFLVIVVDDGTESGFGVSSTGETIYLGNPSGALIDQMNVLAMEETQSYGRFPDGSATLQLLNEITKGASNLPGTIEEKIKINELYSQGDETAPDWVEVYNAGTSPVDLSAYKIYDNGGKTGAKPKKAFPAGTSINAGEFIVIVVDDADASGFGLSSSGETIWLEKADGSVTDSVSFSALNTGESYGRYPDGTDEWQVMTTVTPGTANDNSVVAPTLILKINEIFSKGVDPDFDWVEIYNASTVQVDISGYKIYDGGGQSGTKPKKAFPDGTIIPAGEFFVIVTDDTTASGFGLSSSGEQIWLEDTTGAVVDSVSFPAMVEGQSYGRKPDGSDTFFIFTEITRGSTNNNAATLPKSRSNYAKFSNTILK